MLRLKILEDLNWKKTAKGEKYKRKNTEDKHGGGAGLETRHKSNATINQGA